MNKVCSKCKKNLPLTTDFFYWRKDTRSGCGGYFFNICKECEKARVKNHKSQQWIKGQSHHTENALLKRRWKRYVKKNNLKISLDEYRHIDVLRQFLHINKPILKKLEKKLKRYNPKKRKLTFAEKRHRLFCNYNVPKNKRENYLHYKNIQSLTFKVRYDYDSEFNLKEKLRRQIRKKMEKYPHIGDMLRTDIKKNSDRLYDLLGYTAKDLKEHLEKYFSEGMTWEKFNRGEIHIDHIIPKSHFNLKNKDDIKICWALWNLQPLWAEDNIKKNNKIIYTEQAIKINPIMSISSVFYKQKLRRKFWNEALQRLSDTDNKI